MNPKRMDADLPARLSALSPDRRLPYSAIRTSAAMRLVWCAGALLMLWLCVFWALD